MPTSTPPRAAVRRVAQLVAGMAVVVLPLAGCGSNEPSAGPTPRDISIAPPTAASTTAAPVATPTATGPSSTGESAARPSANGGLDALGAVEAAETAVADSTVVELSRDDDSGSTWEVTVRVGESGRELQVDAGGSVTRNEPDSLSSVQRATLPDMTASRAIKVAQRRVPPGEVTDAVLTVENERTIWEVAVDVRNQDDRELVIDADSGDVIREERD